MTYLIGLGHDLALGALTAIVPQPRSPEGVQAAQREVGADGSIFEQGLFIRLQWSSLANAAAYQTLLAQLGVNSTFLRRAVTIYAPDFERQWHRYNGYALRPRTPTYATFPRNVTILINRLEQIG